MSAAYAALVDMVRRRVADVRGRLMGGRNQRKLANIALSIVLCCVMVMPPAFVEAMRPAVGAEAVRRMRSAPWPSNIVLSDKKGFAFDVVRGAGRGWGPACDRCGVPLLT